MVTFKKLISARGVVALTVLLLMGQTAYAGPIVVGNDVVDRSASDSWNNFVLNLSTEILPISGAVTEWSVYASNEGTLGLLIFDDGVVIGADYENVVEGYNSFKFAADSGTGIVNPGFTLGLWLGSAVVDFTRGPETGDSVEWCLFRGCALASPVAGDSFVFTGSGTGNSLRQYSVSVIDPPLEVTSVPEPGTLALLGLGLIGMGFSKGRKTV